MYFYFTCNKFASIVLFQTSVHLKVIFNEIGCTHTIKSKYSWFFNTNQCHAYQFPIKFYLIIRWNFIWKSCKLMNGYSNINNHKQNCEPLFEFISEHFQHGTITIQVVFERKWKKKCWIHGNLGFDWNDACLSVATMEKIFNLLSVAKIFLSHEIQIQFSWNFMN